MLANYEDVPSSRRDDERERRNLIPGKIWEKVGNEVIEAIEMGEMNPTMIQAFQIVTGMSA